MSIYGTPIFLFFTCSKKGYSVKSYGTGSVVKLPGRAAHQPNVYQFGTTYEDMYQDLMKKDPHLYLLILFFCFLSAVITCTCQCGGVVTCFNSQVETK